MIRTLFFRIKKFIKNNRIVSTLSKYFVFVCAIGNMFYNVQYSEVLFANNELYQLKQYFNIASQVVNKIYIEDSDNYDLVVNEENFNIVENYFHYVENICVLSNAFLSDYFLAKYVRMSDMLDDHIITTDSIIHLENIIIDKHIYAGRIYFNLNYYILKECSQSYRLVFTLIEEETLSLSKIILSGNNNYAANQILYKSNNHSPLKLSRLFDREYLLSLQYSPLESESFISTEVSSFYTSKGYLDIEIKKSISTILDEYTTFVIKYSIDEGILYTIGKVNTDMDLYSELIFSTYFLQYYSRGISFTNKNYKVLYDEISSILNLVGYNNPKLDVIYSTHTKNNTINIYYSLHSLEENNLYFLQVMQDTTNNLYSFSWKETFHGFIPYKNPYFFNYILKIRHFLFQEDVGLYFSDNILAKRGYFNNLVVLVAEDTTFLNVKLNYSPVKKLITTLHLVMPNIFSIGSYYSLYTSFSKKHYLVSSAYEEVFDFQHLYNTISLGLDMSREESGKKYMGSYSLLEYTNIVEYSFIVSLYEKIILGIGFDFHGIGRSEYGYSSIFNWLEINRKYSRVNSFIFSVDWDYVKVNNLIFPVRGKILNTNLLLSLPGSDIWWFKYTISSINYYQLHSLFTLCTKTHFLLGNGYGDTNYLPVYRNFHGGGWGTIRGFYTSSLGLFDLYRFYGESSYKKGNYMGGNFGFFNNVDLIFILPGLKNNVRVSLFIDAGNIFDTYSLKDQEEEFIMWKESREYSKIIFKNIRCSIGWELQWLSPFGPIYLSFSKPILFREMDNLQDVQVSFGKTI